MRKIVIYIVIICSVFGTLYAGGSKDIDTVQMQSNESWHQSIDISGKKKGKYNIIITATDIAGNEGYVGPFNMYIDPNSDLPIVNISNPKIDAVVSGNLNIVGTCLDDDAVDYVEIRIDGGESIYRAKGKEFWSYYINTKNLEEGAHTIEAWGVDVNGVKGKSIKRVFYLNSLSPVTNIVNRTVGELVSGKINIEGTVEDGNGIERLLYSVNDGENFEEVKLSYNKKTKQSNFYLKLDTKKIPDGPKVIWFKAVDKQGSVGIHTFLLFVDNTAPLVEFIYPDTDQPMPPVFSIAGKATDSAGLASLSWKCNNEKGEFTLTPGNPYWIKEFDAGKGGGKTAVVEITAKDIAGNIVNVKKTIQIDQSKGKPVIEMLSPAIDAKVSEELYISGVVHDLYGAGEIRYRIDKGEEKIIDANEAGFGVIEKEISAGSHTLTIYAVNKKGIQGAPISLKFTVEGRAPSISFDNGETVIPVYNAQSKASTSVHVKAPSGLKYISAGFNGEEESALPIKAGQTEYLIKTNINSKSVPGIYTVSVTAADMNDRISKQTLAVRVVNMSGGGAEENFVWAKGDVNENNQIILTDGNPLSGVYQPREGMVIESLEVIGGKNIEAELEGDIIRLSVKADGLYKGVGVKITDNEGNVYTSPQVDILSDTASPQINLDMAEGASFVNKAIVLKGKVSDGAGVKTVEYSLGDGDRYIKLSGSFNESINVGGQPDGPILVTVRAEDMAGRESFAYRVFYKDSEAPETIMVLPEPGVKVNGSVYSAFKVTDRFPGVKAEYKGASKGAEWQSFDYNTLPNLIIGSSKEPLSKNMQFRFTDLAGNSRTFNSYSFEIDNSEDAPVVELHLPYENEIMTGDFEISGMVYDDDEAAKIYYKIDNGAYKPAEIKNSFSIPILLSELTDNEHELTIYAEDIYGVASTPVKRKIRVSLQVPQVGVAYPLINDTLKGVSVISGTATDKNGIKQIEVSLDNGQTYNLAEGSENWQYRLNTHIINDGTHVVFIKATDKYDQVFLYSTLVNIDNTPPVLKLEYPLAGSKLDANLFVSGQVYDNISLEGVMLKIKSLSGTTVPQKLSEIKLENEIILSKDIDISALPEGRYNLEISGVDKANNANEASINFDVYRKKDKNKIELLYPLNGETVRGEFNVYGRLVLDKMAEEAGLYIDGKEIEKVTVSKTGYVCFKLDREKITSGEHKLELRTNQAGRGPLVSEVHTIKYEEAGPWITIDNFAMGDFAIERPYIKGRAGYSVSEEEKAHAASKEATSEDKRAFKAKKLKRVEISFDNGKTFVPVKSTANWKYRLETEDMPEGNHFLLLRAVMENKEVAVCRTIIKIDKTAPDVILISPGEGGRYNGAIDFNGLSSDDIEVAKVESSLRKGDKATYGVPKFIQGLHFETAFWGASLWNIGVGLSFFDDNVKLQIHYGQFLQSQFKAIYGNQQIRYGGHIVSLKLLANVFDLPFGYYFGPDWKWLYLDVALGAQFSLFTNTQSGRPQVLSALLTQIEFPRVKFHKQKYFSAFSFFTEGQLWFIPTDVDSKSKKSKIKSVIPHISAGIRVDIF
ncbi:MULTISPECIES: Ig-like domain-containing protein [unclassified Treponema]|uniref:Ig-like domain-containing protein n=1 Tax=unclassified Treponema TaxID=2638727 RepID=UPI0020A3D478|nr:MULTISPECIES: Ig-like domain-containing protein [unclassified Treponema]UTC66429.1 Ig-like domain-containing protein [Treponema sp. OMZ 789]UTC69160.1 Ig-like domain-containing protein [Treponema sp. OMZ 790]UTC71873.1 Ig-like domain-containing protein [Treponema sp. OMZ 791]